MTVKTAGKVEPKQEVKGPSHEDYRAALEAHTLAQMAYERLAAGNPWLLAGSGPIPTPLPHPLPHPAWETNLGYVAPPWLAQGPVQWNQAGPWVG